MDIPLPDEVLRRGGRLTHVLGKPQGCPEDRTAHLELQPRHGSFWERVHAEEQQQQPLREVHPAPAERGPADDGSCSSDLPPGENSSGLPGPQREELPHLLPDLQRSPRGGEGPVVPPRGSHLLLAAPPREDLGRPWLDCCTSATPSLLTQEMKPSSARWWMMLSVRARTGALGHTAQEQGSVGTSALLLGLLEDHLLETLRIRTIRAGRGRQVFRKPCSQAECDTRRDCLAKLVYARLFDWLVSVINSSICAAPDSWTTFIGLLDVYGFESFPNNSLEQLCINYANEKLQQHFVAHYLRAQQEEYAVEGLEWSFVSYQDNQPCLDLIEGSPVSICSLINEECRLNRPSSAAQLQTRIESALTGRPRLGRDRLSPEPNFIVLHYAGPVRYRTAGLVEKNKDPVPPELTRLLQQSQDPLLKVLFPADPEEKSQEEPSGQNRAPVLTVVSKFKASLEQLLQVLRGTTPHYIRCIKPNSQAQAQIFHREEVLSQLEACGLVETIHISAAGFPIRVSHRNFVERYELLRRLRPATTLGRHGPCPDGGRSERPPCTEPATLRGLLQEILHALPAPLHCGRTKVFMTDSTLELLERARAQVLEQCARHIQRGWRRHRCRTQARRRRAAVLIQAAVRSWLARKHVQRLHAAATVIKRAWREWRIRMAFLASEELDGVEEKHSSQAPCSPSSSPLPLAQTRLQGAITRLWPLGLALANGAVGVHGFQRKLVVFACLQLPVGSPRSCAIQTAQEQAGVLSIRALPQGSIRFHCRKSPLRYADTCPGPSPDSVTGFNQILLERHRPGHV
ncbi:unconventional myosin-XIX isoform X3 [Ovis aries]|uniref:unconventional myosin-XIX isoform X3 n=1 Tax=Ovis aries TaxID=9940 RepID=UPI001C2E412A|nr:unconventional myosin-XIX isoform X3 [Ovis aries]